MKTYNGWTNHETWSVWLRYEGIFADMARTQTQNLADAFEALVTEQEFANLKQTTLATEALGYFLNKVDWEQLAESALN